MASTLTNADTEGVAESFASALQIVFAFMGTPDVQFFVIHAAGVEVWDKLSLWALGAPTLSNAQSRCRTGSLSSAILVVGTLILTQWVLEFIVVTIILLRN